MWRWLARAAVLRTAAGNTPPEPPLAQALEAVRGTEAYGRAVEKMKEVMAEALYGMLILGLCKNRCNIR